MRLRGRAAKYVRFSRIQNLFTRLPTAKITQIKEFTPAAWARAKAKGKLVALAA